MEIINSYKGIIWFLSQFNSPNEAVDCMIKGFQDAYNATSSQVEELDPTNPEGAIQTLNDNMKKALATQNGNFMYNGMPIAEINTTHLIVLKESKIDETGKLVLVEEKIVPDNVNVGGYLAKKIDINQLSQMADKIYELVQNTVTMCNQAEKESNQAIPEIEKMIANPEGDERIEAVKKYLHIIKNLMVSSVQQLPRMIQHAKNTHSAVIRFHTQLLDEVVPAN